MFLSFVNGVSELTGAPETQPRGLCGSLCVLVVALAVIGGVVRVFVPCTGRARLYGDAAPVDEDMAQQSAVCVDVGLCIVGAQLDAAAVDQLIDELARFDGVALGGRATAPDLGGIDADDAYALLPRARGDVDRVAVDDGDDLDGSLVALGRGEVAELLEVAAAQRRRGDRQRGRAENAAALYASGAGHERPADLRRIIKPPRATTKTITTPMRNPHRPKPTTPRSTGPRMVPPTNTPHAQRPHIGWSYANGDAEKFGLTMVIATATAAKIAAIDRIVVTGMSTKASASTRSRSTFVLNSGAGSPSWMCMGSPCIQQSVSLPEPASVPDATRPAEARYPEGIPASSSVPRATKRCQSGAAAPRVPRTPRRAPAR